ncbi:bifunctional 3-dehydroquinate dehydratase/shikimate dehydrogenase, chloroplastic isoform X2 [Cryptomeria japonica]|uniref:bifunctional 3-dehydroquinate dehydratase/shikimate dehydrogenase, chloroplastic isoform X2 n=1 Tax=Cryptomeria japonica TaxID=3369 RepID=UPI0027D9F233|nr:bifunctional 3-dehydroquinate dehydratase/shikimate dehydrogenase, chloroplastic isoform X2 [Cryptomeria japonica]
MAQTSCLVCCPLVANSVEETVIQMQQAKADGADIIELRLDHLHNFNPNTQLQIILNQRPLPIIVTYRPKWEGGEYEGEEATRLDTLRLALELGADYVDVELQVAPTFIKSISEKKSRNSKIIVSSHNYQSTPSLKELGQLVTRIQDTGADIVKIATTATNITDVNQIFQVQKGLHAQSEMTAGCNDVHACALHIPHDNSEAFGGDRILTRLKILCHTTQFNPSLHSCVPIIALAMSSRGLISRILCPKFGGYLTFGSIGIGKESASGQPTLTDLLKIYKIKSLSRDTKIFGIIGNPVGHSKGPILHNQAFREIGFDGIYVPFLVDDLAQFLTVYSTPDFAGFSVTIPHKEAALQCCDEVEPVAQSIGAVNTIVRRHSDGKLIGYNTDYMGAISAVEDGLKGRLSSGDWENISPLSGRLFVVVGAGGAGKALAYGAKEKGARVAIANRNYERAKTLASLVGGEAIPLEKLDSFCPENGMILANTTSVGMHPNVNETPISKEALKSYDLVFDAVYTPKVTRLLREAEETGATVVSGLEMFIRQAMGQFELFTGCPAPAKLMREIAVRNA